MAITAQELAARITVAFTHMIDNADPDDWSDNTRYLEYVAALRTGRARATGPRTIIATMRTSYWGYKVSYAIDAATCDVPEIHENGLITETHPDRYVFTW